MLTACSIEPSGPGGRLAAAFLAMLPNHVAGLSPATEEIVENQALDLIAVSLAMGTAGRTPRVSSARSIILMKVRTAIDARLTDPALNSETVAAAAGVSRRYVNAVLADERTSITQFIQSRSGTVAAGEHRRRQPPAPTRRVRQGSPTCANYARWLTRT